jgi:hypothetical protein
MSPRGNLGLCWYGCQTVGSAPDEKSFHSVANRRDGFTMVPFLRSKRTFQSKRAGEHMNTLEAKIRRLTQPVNGQFPRPWMTDMVNPEEARVFIVGQNQATGFPPALVGGHKVYIDALFNRNGRSCRQLYDAIRGPEGPSPTRKNIDALREALAHVGVHDVLETNVICYCRVGPGNFTPSPPQIRT